MRFSVFILVQLLGAGLCAGVAMPWLAPFDDAPPAMAPRLGAPWLGPRNLVTHLSVPPSALARELAKRSSGPLALALGERTVEVRWRDLGLTIIPAFDGHAIAQAAYYGAMLVERRIELAWSGDARRESDVWIGLHQDRVDDLLTWLAQRLERDPIPARWDFRAGRALGEVTGVRLNRAASRENLLAAAVAGQQTATIVIEDIAPTVRLAHELAGYDPAVLMATFSTAYNARKKDRVANLTLAAAAIDGTILAPGEVFGYNRVVGERSEARGYQNAPVIVQGEIVEGVGGGACQISSTLHAAGIFGGLEIVERYNHSLPSSYIEMGLDSVVAWPTLDLRLRNPYTFPIVLHLYLDGERVRAEIWGPEARDRVVVRRELFEEVPFSETVEVDPTLEPGTIRIPKRGTVGYRVLRARMVWRDGEENFERLPMDTYQPRSQRVVIGPETIYPPPPEPEGGAAGDDDE